MTEQKSNALSPQEDSFTQLKERLSRLDAHIEFEFELTAQRVGYLATTEAFLFTSYVVANANLGKHDAGTIHLQNVVDIVPWVGCFLAAAGLFAVVAAISVVLVLKRERESLRPQATKENISIHRIVEHRNWAHVFGWVPPVAVPAAFIVAWLYVASVDHPNKCLLDSGESALSRVPTNPPSMFFDSRGRSGSSPRVRCHFHMARLNSCTYEANAAPCPRITS